MPYYQLQGAPNGDSYQVYAESPEQAKMMASPRLQVPVSAITVRYSSASEIVNVPFLPGTGPGGGGLGPGGVIGGGGPGVGVGLGGVGGGLGDVGTIGGGAIGSTTLPPDLQADLDAAAPESAFRAGLRQRGFNPEGPLGSILGSQFGTAQANFGLRNFLEGTSLTGVPPNSFRDYTANRDPNASSDALALYKNVQGGAGIPQKSLRNALYSAGIGDTKEQQGFQQNFGDVARGAARARYSPFSARFLPSETTLDREFEDLLYAQGLRGKDAQGVNLLKFLQDQYGF